MKINDGVTAPYDFTFSFKKECEAYNYVASLCKYPTQNCQLSSIGCMDVIFESTNDNAEVRDIIREFHNKLNHPINMILLDVKTHYIDRVRECFKVITETKYFSTNGSEMCLFIVTIPEN